MPRRTALLAALAILAAAVSACGSTNDHALRASLTALRTPPATSKSTTTPTVDCAHPEWRSLRPAGPGPSVAAIRKRGRLIAGVDQNTLLLGYANPLHRQNIEGFEIDLLHELSQALFGKPNRIEYRALTTAERISAAKQEKVDMVVDAVTVTCYRATQVDFSTVYLSAGQRLLVPSGSDARSAKDLAGKRVCSTTTSTSSGLFAKYPKIIPHRVSQRTDCLVDLQQGEVDAITSDDAILLGFQAQDPYTKVIGPVIEPEPYGIAISKRHPDLVRWVNGQLARMRADGTLRRLYRKWLPGTPRQPPVHYGD
jgi:polar amino acid transport system substrate-binding protein